MPLWLKLIKINGFISPDECWYRGFLSWLFRPGYHTSSDDQNNTKLRLSARLERQGKTSREDFDKILGSAHYAKPKVGEDAAKMLQSVAKTAEKLTGGKSCITSIGYSQILVQLLYTIDSEVQLAFQAIYSPVVEAQTSSFQIDASIISSLCKEIKIIFNKVKRY